MAPFDAIVVAVATIGVDFPTATIVWLAFIIVWQRFEDYYTEGELMWLDVDTIIRMGLPG